MSFNLIHIIKNMDVFALCIVGALLIMAVSAMTVFFERLWVFRRSRKKSRRFGAQAGALLERGELERFASEADARAYLAARKKPGELGPVELARREMTRQTEAISADVRRGLSILASVGSVSPFVGLLGTVVGIINAFTSIAASGSGGMAVVSGGIAEALVSTALGIFVAIPAVVAFNHFTGKLENFHVEMNRASSQLVNCLFKIPEFEIPAEEGADARESRMKVTGVKVAAHATR